VRSARLATIVVAAAVAAGLMQAPALATDESSQSASSVTTRDAAVQSTVGAPTNLKVVLGTDSATITFDAPATTTPVVNYEWSDQGGVWVPFAPAVATSPVTIPGIKPGQPYSVTLRAVTAEGPGASSDAVTFKIAPVKPPKPPRVVSFEADGKPIGKGTGGEKVVTLKPGVQLKIRDVPEGSSISIIDKDDPSFTLEVRETNKARMWSTDSLPPARRLWVTVTDTSGAVVGRINFKMARAEKTFTFDVWPKTNNVGAGVPLVVDFHMPITNKAAVEKALVVTSDKKIGEAGWFWVNSTKAVFRPRTYWPGNATITLNANLTSVEGAKGVWGPKVQSTFKTGDQVILKVNLRKYTMKYNRNGVEERTFKISGGMPTWETESGTKILTAHIPNKRLYNPDPVEGWDVTVNWAIRVNDNGEYIHDAPWNYNIGYANTSHGCTNMTIADMQWLWRNTKFGDVAEYTGTNVKMGTDDYLAGYWNYTWPEWKRGSALFKG
jgi:lipoprotein-anchoring transpeptidase ErfK/SrfK